MRHGCCAAPSRRGQAGAPGLRGGGGRRPRRGGAPPLQRRRTPLACICRPFPFHRGDRFNGPLQQARNDACFGFASVRDADREGACFGWRNGLSPARFGLSGGLAVWQLPARPREVAVVAVRVVLEVVLVLGLGLPEGDSLAELGHHLAGPQAGGVDVGDRVLGDPALLVARVEDLGAVAGADVVALAVLGRRVVDLEEELEDVPVGDALGVEDDLDRLGMAGMVPVGRVVVLPTGVTDPRGNDSLAAAQQLLNAPEAAAREDRGFGVVAHRALRAPKFSVRTSLSALVRLGIAPMLAFTASNSSLVSPVACAGSIIVSRAIGLAPCAWAVLPSRAGRRFSLPPN